MAEFSLNDVNDMYMDVLREIGNIGAGNATTAIAQMLGARLDMQVPNVQLMEASELGGAVTTGVAKAISTKALIAIVSTAVAIGGVVVGSQLIDKKQETATEQSDSEDKEQIEQDNSSDDKQKNEGGDETSSKGDEDTSDTEKDETAGSDANNQTQDNTNGENNGDNTVTNNNGTGENANGTGGNTNNSGTGNAS